LHPLETDVETDGVDLDAQEPRGHSQELFGAEVSHVVLLLVVGKPIQHSPLTVDQSIDLAGYRRGVLLSMVSCYGASHGLAKLCRH
jgi:hypothetical protein